MTRLARLNERLAAAFHQRMVAMLGASERVSRDVAALYARLADRAATEAARSGFAGMARFGEILDRLLVQIRREAARRLAELVRLGRRTAAAALGRAGRGRQGKVF